MKIPAMRGVGLASLIAAAGGCTTVHVGHVLTPESERTIRQDAQPRAPLEVVVPVGGGRQADGKLVRVLSTEAIVLVQGNEISVPPGAIHRVDVNNHARG